VQSALSDLPGVASTSINLKTGEVVVHFDAEKVTPEKMAAAVTKSGFESHVKRSNN